MPNDAPHGISAVFRSRKIFLLLLLGFASGLPLALTAGTLQAWLAVERIELTTIGLFALVGQPSLWIRILSRIALIPVIAVISYEIMKFGASHSGNPVVRVLLAPGLLLQTMTTREPDDSQIEAAISALNEVIEIDKAAVSADAALTE